MSMAKYHVLLFVVDIAIVLHSLGRFFMSLVCKARVYIRGRIRNLQSKNPVSTCPEKQNEVATHKNGLINSQQLNILRLVATNSYFNFAYNALLAFAVASYICFTTLFTELLVLLTRLYLLIRRYLLLWGLMAKCNSLPVLQDKAKRLLDMSTKKLPQNVTLIIPSLGVNKLNKVEESLQMSLNFCRFLQVNSITLYFPFLVDSKLEQPITKIAEKFSTVSCVFSMADSESIFLQALSTVKSDSFEVADVTKRMYGSHADMVMVYGGLPSLYGYIPWHTKLSEIFFLPDMELVTVEDVEKAFTSFLSIEQRFGK